MKDQSTVKKSIVCSSWLGSLVAGLGVAAMLAAAVPAHAEDFKTKPEVVTPYLFDLYPDLLAKWWQWTFSFPANADPASDTAPQDSNQSGPIWFLAGVHGSAQTGVVSVVTRQITMPEGKLLFFPVLATWSDNSGCPNFSNLTAHELRAENTNAWSAVTETTCTIDGKTVRGLGNPQTTPYLVQSPSFSYKLAKHDNILAADFGEPCIPDGMTISPAEAEGVCLLIAPLARGHHTIHFVGVVGPVTAPFVEIDETYEINVVEERK